MREEELTPFVSGGGARFAENAHFFMTRARATQGLPVSLQRAEFITGAGFVLLLPGTVNRGRAD